MALDKNGTQRRTSAHSTDIERRTVKWTVERQWHALMSSSSFLFIGDAIVVTSLSALSGHRQWAYRYRCRLSAWMSHGVGVIVDRANLLRRLAQRRCCRLKGLHTQISLVDNFRACRSFTRLPFHCYFALALEMRSIYTKTPDRHKQYPIDIKRQTNE